MKYDYLIVGAGFFGSICAYELSQKGYRVRVIDKREHIGGNCYTKNRDGINVHEYGPHIFHTSNKDVWNWINQFTQFNNYINTPVANYKGDIYSLPFSMWTFSKMWGVSTPEQARAKIKEQSNHIKEPRNLEEQAIKLVGTEVYEKLVKGYTEKQWGKDAKDLPKEIIQRLPVRFTYDNNYFNDKYQGIPIGGYTPIFEKLLDGIEVTLGVDFFEEKEYLESLANRVIYTGPIDRYYGYRFGNLEYKTVTFEHSKCTVENVQGTSVMNYTDRQVPYTRIIEHKHFEKTQLPISWITHEYPTEYIPEKTEPMYPVNDQQNMEKYRQYRELADKEKSTIFGGRLAEYKYYDMDDIIESALNTIKHLM